MPTVNLDTLIEAACVKLLTTAGVTAFAGMDDSTLTLPSSVVCCRGGTEFPIGSGNFWQTMSVKHSSAADVTTLVDHRSDCADTFNVFMSDTLAADLSATFSNFCVIGVRNRRYEATSTENRIWTSELTFEALTCASDL